MPKFGFSGLCLLIGIITFSIQQGCAVTGNSLSWAWGSVWFSIAILLVVLAVWFWDATASHHWLRKSVLTCIVVAAMGYFSYIPVVKEYRLEHGTKHPDVTTPPRPPVSAVSPKGPNPVGAGTSTRGPVRQEKTVTSGSPGPGIRAYIMPSSYPADFELAGIKWKPLYSDARLDIENSSKDIALEHLDLLIEFGDAMQIAGAAQITALPDVHLLPDRQNAPVAAAALNGTDKNGNEMDVPILGLAAFEPFAPRCRVLCSRLPAATVLKLVLAPVAVNEARWENGTPTFPTSMYDKKRAPHFIRITGRYDLTEADGKHPTFELPVYYYDFVTKRPL